MFGLDFLGTKSESAFGKTNLTAELSQNQSCGGKLGEVTARQRNREYGLQDQNTVGTILNRIV